MRGLRIWLVLAIVAVALSVGVAAGQPGGAAGEKPEAKAESVVYLRGDAVGVHLNYVPAATQMPTVRGSSVRIDPEWVVVFRGGRQVMVPRSAVLMVDTPQ
jgi:hypothetical protein